MIIFLIVVGFTFVVLLGVWIRSSNLSEDPFSQWAIPQIKDYHGTDELENFGQGKTSTVTLNAGTGSVPKPGSIYDSLALATSSHPSVAHDLVTGSNDHRGSTKSGRKIIGLYGINCIRSQIQYASIQEYKFVLTRKPFIRLEDSDRNHRQADSSQQRKNSDREFLMFLTPLLLEELQKPLKERLGWIFWIPAESFFMNINVPLHIFLPPEDFSYVNIIGSVDDEGQLNQNSILGFRVNTESIKLLIAAWNRGEDSSEPSLSSLIKEPRIRKWRNMFVTVPNRWFASISPEDEGSDQQKRGEISQSFKYGDLVLQLNDHSIKYINKTLSHLSSHPDEYNLPLAKTSIPKPVDFWQKQRKLRKDSKYAVKRTDSRYNELTSKWKTVEGSSAAQKKRWDYLEALMKEIRTGSFKHETDAALAKDLLDEMEEILKGWSKYRTCEMVQLVLED